MLSLVFGRGEGGGLFVREAEGEQGFLMVFVGLMGWGWGWLGGMGLEDGDKVLYGRE